MKYSIILLVTLFWCGIGISQQCESILLGEIVDFHDNTPLDGAVISISGKNEQTISKNEGEFRFENLCNGIIELEISHPECTTKFITIIIEGDTYEKILLEHHLEELEEVHVTGAFSKTTTSAQEERLTQRELEKFSGASLGEALKSLNGVSSLNTGGNIVKPVIQGLMGSRVLILNNNVRMQDMEWGEEHAPNVDINANQDISVVKGAAALEYGGDAIGGVIVMNPLPIIRTDSLFGKTQTSLFSNGRGGNITTSLTRSYNSGLYIRGQASFKQLGDLEAPDYVLSNTGILEKGVSFSIGKRDFLQGWEAYYSFFDSDIGILRASHIGNVDDLIQAINSEQPNRIDDFSYTIDPPKQEVSHHLGKLTYYRRYEGLGKWNIQYDFQKNRRFEYDVRVGDDANKASLDLSLTTQTISTDFQFDATDGLEFKAGLLGRFQNNFANPETGVRRLIPDYDKYDVGIFTIAEYQPKDNLVLDAGIRYDFSRINAKKFYRTSRWEERGYNQDFGTIVIDDLGTQLLTNPIFDFHNISATTGFEYDFGKDTRLRFNYSLAQRAPNPSELFSDGLHHSAARIELGDLRIKSETASKLSLSLEKNSNSWGYTLAPFLNSIPNFIILEPGSVEFTIRGAFPVWAYRQTNAQLIGIDAAVYNNWNANIRTDHKFSLVQGTDTETDIPLINMPPATINNSITYKNKKLKNLILGLESIYVFEQQRFPPNFLVFSPEQQVEVPLAINKPPPSYHLIAMDMETSYAIKNKNDFKVGLRVTNILNTNYRDYLNRQRYFVDDLGRNISLRVIYNY